MKALYLILSCLLISCSSSENITVTTAQSKALDQLVIQKSFVIESEWASPMATNSINAIANSGLLPPGSTANNISLIGNNNFFKVQGDSIIAYLPYYGERQMSGGYNTNNAIEFKGVPDTYEVTKDEKNKRYILSFEINANTETYRGNVTLFPNLTSTIFINSSHRLPINYRGRVAKLVEKE